MIKYEELNTDTASRMVKEKTDGTFFKTAFNENCVTRRNPERDKANIWRTAFIRDIDKIMHCPYYNRYTDKTQVFSFYRNDDITRRGLHVQLVSRTARTIGKALNLNQDLIEAIALGHDIGHTPFGHTGEKILDELLSGHTGRHFSHNIHSVRVLDKIFPYNLTLQTLNGIASHDGELEQSEYKPEELQSFADFDSQIEMCYTDKSFVRQLVPCTLEGCVVKISDIIAYLGKDRQDAERAKIITGNFSEGALGTVNATIIHNLIVNIIENSYGKDYIALDSEHFSALVKAKEENYKNIYLNDSVCRNTDENIRTMMNAVYNKLLEEIKGGNEASVIFRHHIKQVESAYYTREFSYRETEPNQLVTDYIASMTDDYFTDLYKYLFPKGKCKIAFHGYFD